VNQASQQSITDPQDLANDIRQWGEELGFQQIGFSDIDLRQAEERLAVWLERNFHGEMSYMSRHGAKRSRPELLVPGTLSVITARMDYLTDDQENAKALLDHAHKAYVSRYALGRDYHKVLRGRLSQSLTRASSRTCQAHRKKDWTARSSNLRRQRAGAREAAR
jgi:epoxyqueuosine reductase